MPFLTLAAQCVAMFVASFAIGYLPLAFKSAMKGQCARWSRQAYALSLQKLTLGRPPGRTLKAVSVFGMGLLVGAALTVIIPECVQAGAARTVPQPTD